MDVIPGCFEQDWEYLCFSHYCHALLSLNQMQLQEFNSVSRGFPCIITSKIDFQSYAMFIVGKQLQLKIIYS